MKHSKRVDHRPSFQFYPSDWLSAPDLSVCSLAAQGLWIKILCWMFLSPKRGVLLLPSHSKMDSKSIAKLCGETEATITVLLKELIDAGVCNEDEGIISNRRMLRDQEISDLRSAVGRRVLVERWHKSDSKPIAKVIAKRWQTGEKEEEKEVAVDALEVKKEIKKAVEKEKYLEFVLLTREQHLKLVAKFGPAETEGLIQRLNDYIGQIGEAAARKKYVSHYHTIMNWARRDTTSKPASKDFSKYDEIDRRAIEEAKDD